MCPGYNCKNASDSGADGSQSQGGGGGPPPTSPSPSPSPPRSPVPVLLPASTTDEVGGCSCKNTADWDAGASQVGGGGPPSPASSPSTSPPRSPVPVLLPSSSTHEVPSDLWDINVNGTADFTGAESGDNKKNIMALVTECDQENFVIMYKIKLLSQKYEYFRPIERDGNCFYRAFFFSYLEHALEVEDASERRNEVAHLRKCFEKVTQAYEITSSSWVSKTCSIHNFNAFEYVLGLIEAGLSADQLYRLDMKEQIMSNILPFLRLMTAVELCTREEFYYPFLTSVEEYESVDEFCEYEVSPMETEANHSQITALVNALGIPLILENLDTSLSYGYVKLNQHPFCPRPDPDISPLFANSAEETEERTFADLSPAERRRLVTLLYRPGHYDILYPK